VSGRRGEAVSRPLTQPPPRLRGADGGKYYPPSVATAKKSSEYKPCKVATQIVAPVAL